MIELKQPALFQKGALVFNTIPKRVHYLGHVTARAPIKWRDPGDLGEKLAAEIPSLTVERVITEKPKAMQVFCDQLNKIECTEAL